MVDELHPIPPIYDGLHLLQTEAAQATAVFSVSTVARDFHVGANDALEVLRRGVRAGLFSEEKFGSEPIFVPRNRHSNSGLKRTLNETSSERIQSEYLYEEMP